MEHIDWLHSRGPSIGILTFPERTDDGKLIPAYQVYKHPGVRVAVGTKNSKT